MPKKKSAKSQVPSTKKSAGKTAKTTANDKPRRLPLPKRVWYKPWTWARNLPAPAREPLPKARHMLVELTKLLTKNWKPFLGIAAIYGVLNLLLVRGLSDPTSLTEFKGLLNGLFTGTLGHLQSALTSFAILLTTSNSNVTESSGVYQSLLLLIASLAIIYALRQVYAGHAIRVRDGYYQGMYPLVPYVVLLVVMSIQLLPAVIGAYLYGVAVSNGIAAGIVEQICFGAVFALLALWSLRMITATIFALYIVTLPDMTPMLALRSAKDLVYKRRLLIWRKLLLLPVVLLLAVVLIELPLILFLTPLAYWVFFAFSTASVVFFHGYIYVLYRKLL